MKRCAHKLAFDSKEGAKRFKRRKPGARNKRIYQCDDCGQWHLTSMTLTEQEEKGLR